MRSDAVFTVIFVLVVATVLIGEAYVYTQDAGRYSSDVRVNGDGVLEYSMTSKGSEQYSVVVSDNGSFEKIEKYYIYYDTDYGSKVEKVQVPVGARELNQEYHISQLVKLLNNRGICDIDVPNAADLKEKMELDVTDGKCSSRGLIVLSGALPDTIYTGLAGDPIFKWIGAGGSLYWAGNLLGKYYATADGKTTEVTNDYEFAFFGRSGCLNTGDEDHELQDIVSNDYRHSLSLMNNRVRYGVDVSIFAAGDALAVGYTDGRYGSAVTVKHGAGMICVLAGDYSNAQRHDLAQLIASGIYYDSKEIGHVAGNIKRGTVTGTMEGVSFASGINYTAYVYYGGYYTVYGKMTGWEQ